METKKDIRKRVLRIRNGMCQEEWEEKSLKVQEQVIAHPFFLNADAIYCYVDYKNEVGTQMIIEKAWKLQKKVAVPKVEGDEMRFYYISDFQDLGVGYRGIREPKTDFLANDKNVLVIVPGVAFDKKFSRVGYGKGFYDKYMNLHSDYKTIAVGFACQIVDDIPTDAYDYRPDVIITEEHIYEH